MSIAPIISNDEDLYLGSVIVTMRDVGYPISESSRGAIEKAIRRAAAEEKVARLRAFDAARVAAETIKIAEGDGAPLGSGVLGRLGAAYDEAKSANALWALRRDLGRILADLDANPAVSPCAEASS